MKQGIIMEQHPDYTMIMTKDGGFLKAKRIPDRKIGDEVKYELYVKEKKRLCFIRKTPIKMLALACILLIIILPIYFLTDKEHTFAYVNIDINPSIEIEVDKHLKVAHFRPLNADADILVKDLTHLKKMSIDEAVMAIMKICEKNGITNAEKNMLIGVSYHPDSKNREVTHVKERINLLLNEKTDWKVTAYNVPAQVREIATEKNTSVNQVMANKIMAEDEIIVKEFNHDNHKENNKKEMITTFYSKKDKQKKIPPEQKKVNDQSQGQNNKVSQERKRSNSQLEEKKKASHKRSDHPTHYKGPSDRPNSLDEHYKNSDNKLRGKERVYKEKNPAMRENKKSGERGRQATEDNSHAKQNENREQGHINRHGNEYDHPHPYKRKMRENYRGNKEKSQGNVKNQEKIEKGNQKNHRHKSSEQRRNKENK